MATNQHSNDAYYRVGWPKPHVYMQARERSPRHTPHY